jgi:integrase
MRALRKKHLHTDLDNITWIRMERQKTGSQVLVPLLKQALDLLDKLAFYEAEHLPVVSNPKINKNLKEIGSAAGIEKPITHHMARKTFATSVLLYHKVPMEIVSKLLGHSSMRITQGHYGKIVDASLRDAIQDLQNRL